MDRNWELTAAIADRTIDVPCLMISATDDRVLTPAMADGMEARVPNVEKIVIEHCGHWTQQEHPQETTAAMLAYLRRLTPGLRPDWRSWATCALSSRRFGGGQGQVRGITAPLIRTAAGEHRNATVAATSVKPVSFDAGETMLTRTPPAPCSRARARRGSRARRSLRR